MRKTSNNHPLRIGLIGAGRIVERAHLPVLLQNHDASVIGLFDPDYERAMEISSRFNVPYTCRSLDELFALDLDATLIACPNHLHADMTIAALEAKTHVICEKPMAISVTQAEAMLNKAETVGRELMAVSTNRFRPEVIALQDIIRDDILGEIKAVRCGWLRRQGIPGLSTWFTSRNLAGGGVLTDLGSHLLDLVISIIGRRKVNSVSCVTTGLKNGRGQSSWYAPKTDAADGSCDVEINASGFVVFEGPLDLFIEVSWDCCVQNDRTYLQFIGQRGAAQIETLFGFSPNGIRPKHPLQIWVEGCPADEPVIGSDDLLQPYRDQWEFFIDSLRQGRKLSRYTYEALEMVRVIDAMYKSALYIEESSAIPNSPNSASR